MTEILPTDRVNWRQQMIDENLWDYSLKWVPVPPVRQMVEEIEQLRLEIDALRSSGGAEELPALSALVSRKLLKSAVDGCATLSWEELRRIDDALASVSPEPRGEPIRTCSCSEVGGGEPDYAEGCLVHGTHRWEIEPHLEPSDADILIVDDDDQARDHILEIAEHLWDQIEPGQERVLKIRLRHPPTKFTPPSSATTELPAECGNSSATRELGGSVPTKAEKQEPRPTYHAKAHDPSRKPPCLRCGAPWNQHKISDEGCPTSEEVTP